MCVRVQVFGIAKLTRYMVLENKCIPMLEDSVTGLSHLSLMHERQTIAERSIVQHFAPRKDGERGEKPCQAT